MPEVRALQLHALRDDPRAPLVHEMIERALAAVDPGAAVRRHLEWLTPTALRVGEVVLDLPIDARIVVVAAGKAAPAMLDAALEALHAPSARGPVVPRRIDALCTAPPTHGPEFARANQPDHSDHSDHPGHGELSIHRHHGGHPLPNAASVRAGRQALQLAEGLRPTDFLLALVSGGASAMLCAPREPWTLEGVRALTEFCLRHPLPIETINPLRAHVDAIKFGGLAAAAAPARAAALILSDVRGDPPELVGGGPTRAPGLDEDPEHANAAERLDALDLLDEFAGTLTRALADHGGARDALAALHHRIEHPRPSYRPFDGIIASNRDARRAVLDCAKARGYTPVDLGWQLSGTPHACAREVLTELDRPELGALFPAPRACALGGETVVRVRGEGRGGRNLELALAIAEALAATSPSSHRLWLSLATDGLDGNSGLAGAVVTPQTLARAAAAGIDTRAARDQSDVASVFEALGDAIELGATGTNVCDLAVALD